MRKKNIAWHEKNKMASHASINQKIQWHADHARECGCRPIPHNIQDKMNQRKPKLVVGILVRNKNRFLLSKEKLEGGREYWIVPGGKVEFGETIEDAAKREILEETGVKTKDLEFLVYKEAIFPEYNYHTVIFFFETKTNSLDLKSDIEGKVIESKWFTKKEIKKLKLVESAEWLFKEVIS